MTTELDLSDPVTLSSTEALAILRARLRALSGDAELREALRALERALAIRPPTSIGRLEQQVEQLDAQVGALRRGRFQP